MKNKANSKQQKRTSYDITRDNYPSKFAHRCCKQLSIQTISQPPQAGGRNLTQQACGQRGSSSRAHPAQDATAYCPLAYGAAAQWPTSY